MGHSPWDFGIVGNGDVDKQYEKAIPFGLLYALSTAQTHVDLGKH